MSPIRAVAAEPQTPGRLAPREVDEPSPGPGEALVRAVEAPWSEIAEVAQPLLDRRFAGKAVLHVAPWGARWPAVPPPGPARSPGGSLARTPPALDFRTSVLYHRGGDDKGCVTG